MLILIHHAVLSTIQTDNKNRKIRIKGKTQGSPVLWVIYGFCRDSHMLFCGYGMGMGIKIQSPRQPCWEFLRRSRGV